MREGGVAVDVVASWHDLQLVAGAQATVPVNVPDDYGAVGVPVGGRGGGDAVAGEGAAAPSRVTLVDAPAAPVA